MKLGESKFIRVKDADDDPRVSHTARDFYKRQSLQPAVRRWDGQVFINVPKYLSMMEGASYDHREEGNGRGTEVEGTGGWEVGYVTNPKGCQVVGSKNVSRIPGRPTTNLRGVE